MPDYISTGACNKLIVLLISLKTIITKLVDDAYTIIGCMLLQVENIYCIKNIWQYFDHSLNVPALSNTILYNDRNYTISDKAIFITLRKI